MIDNIVYNILGFFDDILSKIDSIFVSKKTKRKKNKCKNCHCKCHCKDDLHLHHDDKDLCTCEVCKCTKN
jgi:hypothetical protein